MVARDGGEPLGDGQELIKTNILGGIALVLRGDGGVHFLKRRMKRFGGLDQKFEPLVDVGVRR